MATISNSSVSFEETDTRRDEMHSTIEDWIDELVDHVDDAQSAIWIWAPIITKQCSECENSPSYHEQSDCEYDETSPDEWSKGLVGFKPTAVFDISQTEGEPLPELETEATGDAEDLVSALTDVAADLGVTVRIVDAADWEHGDAKGVCKYRSQRDLQPVVEAKAHTNQADLAVTLIHEYAHAVLHADVTDETE